MLIKFPKYTNSFVSHSNKIFNTTENRNIDDNYRNIIWNFLRTTFMKCTVSIQNVSTNKQVYTIISYKIQDPEKNKKNKREVKVKKSPHFYKSIHNASITAIFRFFFTKLKFYSKFPWAVYDYYSFLLNQRCFFPVLAAGWTDIVYNNIIGII